jgi:hypothetical protein
VEESPEHFFWRTLLAEVSAGCALLAARNFGVAEESLIDGCQVNTSSTKLSSINKCIRTQSVSTKPAARFSEIEAGSVSV